MHTHKNRLHALCERRWHIAAIACGLTCSMLVHTGGNYGAYLQNRLMEWRQTALRESVATPVRRTVPSETARRRTLEQILTTTALHPAAPEPHSRTLVMLDATPSFTTDVQRDPASVSSFTAVARAFPPMIRTVFPLERAVNWGAMDRPQQWSRTYGEMTERDFVPVPTYDLAKLTIPLQGLLSPRNAPEITRKLFYSTRFFGAYDLDSGEWVKPHAALDLKAPLDTPVLAAAGGRVESVRRSASLGTHVVIEHRHPTDGTFYTIYAHLGSVAVAEGEDVAPGEQLGTVGMTGYTSGPHVHFQVDLPSGAGPHVVYQPEELPSRAEAAQKVVHPIDFIEKYAGGA